MSHLTVGGSFGVISVSREIRIWSKRLELQLQFFCNCNSELLLCNGRFLGAGRGRVVTGGNCTWAGNCTSGLSECD